MAEPQNPKYVTWPRTKRFSEGIRLVLHEKWNISEAAREVGVSRQHLSQKVKVAREEFEARLERERQYVLSKEEAAARRALEEERRRQAELGKYLGPLGLQERLRVPDTFQEFDDYYFSHFVCPDCGVPHKRKPFHDEIIDAIFSPANRVVCNVPPFHAKSTYGTVRSTVYAIAKNPNIRRIIISKSGDFARTFLQSIQELLTNEDLYLPDRNLIADVGPFRGSQSVWSRDQIYVAGRVTAEKDPTVQVLGVGTQIYGRRADEIIGDDVATLENQRNPDRVLKMLEWFDKEVSSRVGKSGKVVWIGTRVSPGDIYATLRQRQGYKVIQYSCVLDDTNEEVLWPEHFPYGQALVHRAEMSPADFQLIYQNVDVPGLGASFTPEMLEECKDTSRVAGHYDPSWRLVAGLDPAGANKGSGYTAMTLLGIDLRTGNRFLVDQVAVKAMKAPQLRDQMFDWTDRYPISEWRVENNGLQSQLVQYNEEIVRYLARKGVRVVPHHTQGNKWDPQFGVESIAPLMSAGMFSIPWGNAPSAQVFQPLLEQLIAFPMGVVNDRVMSLWFAELGCRQYLERGHLPLFSERMRVPERIRRRRRVVNFETRQVENVPLHLQRRGALGAYGRTVLGRPVRHDQVEELPPSQPRRFVNVPGEVDSPGSGG